MKCAHAMKTRFTNNRLMMAMRTARILDQGRQTPKHKIRDVRVCASDEGMYGGSRPSGQKQARPHAERCACLLNGAIHNRRDCIASTKLHRGTRVAPKKCAARAPTAGALEDAARIAQQAFDHETRTRNDRAAHMTPMRVNQIDRHGRADIDYTYRTARSELSGANDGDKPIDAEPPRLRIRCGHATRRRADTTNLGTTPLARRAAAIKRRSTCAPATLATITRSIPRARPSTTCAKSSARQPSCTAARCRVSRPFTTRAHFTRVLPISTNRMLTRLALR